MRACKIMGYYMMRVVSFLLVMLMALSTPVVHAATRIDITKGTMNPLPVAIPVFIAAPGLESEAQGITEVIGNNLTNSGLFKVIDRQAYIEQFASVDQVPQFANWRQINAQSVIVGEVKPGATGIDVSFRVWDVLSGKQLAGQTFKADRSGWRRVGHLVSDQIYSRMTGEDGYFDTRVVYVAESGDWRRPTKRLAVMDQDGANQRYLTSGRALVLTPRFDNDSQRIIYMSYEHGQPAVYLYNLTTGREELVGNFPGMSFAPRFSYKNDKAIMSVSQNGNAEIYVLDLASHRANRLTNDPSIDTSPSFSPDDSQITFASDRSGSQQIYVMNADGSNQRRISFGKGNYATPVWSPRGDLIAFTRIHGGKFYIGVMRTDGSGERLLTESYMDEGPTWSPNGRVIMFGRKSPGTNTTPGQTKIVSVDLTGYNERIIPTSSEASDPAWSPLLSKQ